MSTAVLRSRAELAQVFQAHRPRLLRLAYATTGSLAEVEDVVQEAWLRLARLPGPGQVRDLAAWLTTTVSRLALDALTSARARRDTLRAVASRAAGRGPGQHRRSGRPGHPG